MTVEGFRLHTRNCSQATSKNQKNDVGVLTPVGGIIYKVGPYPVITGVISPVSRAVTRVTQLSGHLLGL